ncbi:MmgE/PrpD family protein [Sphingomonas dokdonensis]|uniref:MmgE/PrpD family protein n=1 Tax=Sphingomonas dokdonensis TaxID=344880 RepID=A0A245ZL12_9SPHN|nr:MmgE/PrpD family protein [Sphingomonas dokdonensis]OWK30427.1 MmgE/PrpD family protein [Sphingomonas dokdonensis]
MQQISRRDALAGALAGSAALALPARAAQTETNGTVPVAVTPALTDYIANAPPAPPAIRERARLHILDTLASIIACRDLEAATLARAYAAAQGGGAVPILGSSARAGMVDAIFASAMTAHGAEINDFIPSAYVQPGPSIVSAALLLAQARGTSGRQVVDAVTVGYELAGRIPKAIGTGNLMRAGLANHGVGPVFGTGAAAARILALDPGKVAHVLSYCAEQASGSWQWMLDVRHVEKAFVFAGMGARNGVQAALMVEAGFTGVPDAFDVEGGWLRSAAFTSEGANRAYLIEQLGTRFELTESAFKRYPSGGPTQPAVEALLALRQQVKPGDVEHIRIAMPGRWQAFRDARMPALNLPYLASIIMLDGKLDFVAAQSLERMNDDPAVAAFRQKVEVVHDPAQEAAKGQPRTESARVTITRRGKPALEKYVPFVRGFPSHPMSRADVEAKAHELVDPVFGRGVADELIERTIALDDAANVDALVALVCR